MGAWVCVASDGEVPRSVSRVVLRVGARLQLRCAPGVLSWAKDGLSLRDGYKYNIHNTLLTVRHTGTIDTLSLSTPHLLSLFTPPLPSFQEWLSSRVVSVLDSGAEGPGFKSQPQRCRVTVLGKLFTPIVPLFTKQQSR